MIISDVLEACSEFATMNLALSYLVNQVTIRMNAQILRQQEIDMLVENGATFDDAAGELLMQSEVSNRCFLFRLDPLYPIGGLASAKIVLIEVLEEGELLSEWNEKMRGYQSITDFIPLLV